MRGFGSMTLLAGVTLLGAACGGSGAADSEARPPLTWEEFRAQALEDEEGVYVFGGDLAVEGEQGLRAYYDAYVGAGEEGTLRDGLAVYSLSGVDVKWSATQARNLTYCVSAASFGSRYSTYDSNCTATQTGVLFDVRMVSGAGYMARAFFPNASRESRNLLIDSSVFGGIAPYTITGLLRHELGHVLGFVHEPTTGCPVSEPSRRLTAIDPASVMVDPDCGMRTGDYLFSTLDKQGARALYP